MARVHPYREPQSSDDFETALPMKRWFVQEQEPAVKKGRGDPVGIAATKT